MEKGKSSELKVIEAKKHEENLVLSVEVDSEVVSKAYRKVYRQLLKHIHVPGFRPGKIPLPVVSNFVGRENFTKEVRKELLPKYYYEAVKQTPYVPIEKVVYEEEHLSHGEAFTFKANVMVAPEVKLGGDYRKLDFKAKSPEPVTDVDIEKTLQQVQRDKAQTAKAEDSIVQEGDYLMVSFVGSVDGRDFKTLTKENVPMVIGRDDFITGFDQNLIGIKKDEEFTFALTVPKKGTENEFLVGKKVLFKGKIKSVFRHTLPPIDDELAKKAGKFNNLEELKEKITRDLEEHRKKQIEEENKEGVKKSLAEIVEVELPAALIKLRVDDRLVEFRRLLEGKNLTFEDYLAEYGKDENAVREEFQSKVVQELKIQFALDFLAKEENLTVTDEEFDNRIKAMSYLLRKEPDEVLEMLDETGQRFIQRQDLLREKAFDSLKQLHL